MLIYLIEAICPNPRLPFSQPLLTRREEPQPGDKTGMRIVSQFLYVRRQRITPDEEGRTILGNVR